MVGEVAVRQAWEGPARTRWVQAVNLVLGAWLVTTPLLGYTSAVMARSDAVAGVVLIVLSLLGLRFPAARYTTAFVGLWLVLAPLLFWSPDALAYTNDTIVGAMVLAFTLMVPHSVAGADGSEHPPGWSYNPSSWPQRAPVLVLGLVGFLVARYLAAFQLGYVDVVWDPIFGNGSEQVLRSRVALAWPVSDAGLGALACLAAIGMAFLGDQQRWRTMPWLVVMFALLVIPLGVYGLVLVLLQPLAVGAGCTLCLVVSAAMLLLVPVTLDELVATVQYLRGATRGGASAWWTFWLGGERPEGALEGTTQEELVTPGEAVRGMGTPISLLASALVGAAVIAAPRALDVASGPADPVVGALVIAVSTVALAEVARPVRVLLLPLALGLLVVPAWLGTDPALAWVHRFAGALLVLLTVPPGRLREHYGPLDRALAWPRRVAG